jgi:hypothetical protein
VNRFGVRCPGCAHLFRDAIVEGFSRLVHPGEPSTASCIASIRYVLFRARTAPCNHCGPESFAACPVCYQGVPSDDSCRAD